MMFYEEPDVMCTDCCGFSMLLDVCINASTLPHPFVPVRVETVYERHDGVSLNFVLEYEAEL